MIEKKFFWRETMNCPPGYPVDVYKGGLLTPHGGASLYLGTHTGLGGWGHTGGSMSSSVKEVPNHLDVIWLSYAEDRFYHIDTPIDQAKMISLFEEGYIDFYTRKPETYNTIIVGFAPGGVVVVWLSGVGRQVEIGRYQGKETVVPPEEIARLDNHERLLFDPEYRKKTMLNERIVPLEIREANKNKPIPYGLWDTYRKKYNWRPIYLIRTGGVIDDSMLFMYNGEKEDLFDNGLNTRIEKRAIPETINFTWKESNGQRYVAVVHFKEEEIFKVFSEIYSEDPDLEMDLELRTDLVNSYVVLTLRTKYGERYLFDSKIKVYKSRLK